MNTFTITCEHCQEDFTYTTRYGTPKKYCSVHCRSNRWYSLNKDKEKARREKFSSNFYERKILSRIKHRCKANDIPFDLEPNDIEIPTHCPILGIEIRAHVKGKSAGYNPEAASIDRIDPKRGYVKGNIRVISARANLLKSDATLEELRAVLSDLEELYDTNRIL